MQLLVSADNCQTRHHGAAKLHLRTNKTVCVHNGCRHVTGVQISHVTVVANILNEKGGLLEGHVHVLNI